MSTCNLFYLSSKPFLITKAPFYSQSPFSNANRQSLSRPPTPLLLRCSSQEREEERWLREEQRWLREEQRWLREESRWQNEREALFLTISALKLQIKGLKPEKDDVDSATLIPVLGSGAVPLVLEAVAEEERENAEVVKEVREKAVAEEVRKRGTLRSGSEGDDVKKLQEALQKVGFYCGEEDEEFSSFSSGTERAVKTWQASLGIPEDGIMTAELQERLYTESEAEYSSLVLKETVIKFPKEGVNGAAVASVTDISEIRKKVVEEKSSTELDITQHRVFLLGENRWEEPSRLIVKNKADGGAKRKGSAITCLSCRGVGRVLCAECDGSGEPNIEEQFLEWVDEGMKCPYCEGHGFTTCDVCDGEGEALV